MISQGPQPDFKIVSASLSHCYNLAVCYRAQRCGQTQEWPKDRGTSLQNIVRKCWLCFRVTGCSFCSVRKYWNKQLAMLTNTCVF